MPDLRPYTSAEEAAGRAVYAAARARHDAFYRERGLPIPIEWIPSAEDRAAAREAARMVREACRG